MEKTEQIVSDPQNAVLNSTQPISLFLGGVGSGKTHLLGIKSYQYVSRFPTVRGFIGANTYLAVATWIVLSLSHLPLSNLLSRQVLPIQTLYLHELLHCPLIQQR